MITIENGDDTTIISISSLDDLADELRHLDESGYVLKSARIEVKDI